MLGFFPCVNSISSRSLRWGSSRHPDEGRDRREREEMGISQSCLLLQTARGSQPKAYSLSVILTQPMKLFFGKTVLFIGSFESYK